MSEEFEKMCVVYLATYPPRECGIATFTEDLVTSFDQLFVQREDSKVVAMNNHFHTYKYPEKVLFSIEENNANAYIEAAQKLNEMAHVKLISIQHEFGIFGQNHGKNILFFLEEIRKPVIVTFHTVLPNPNEEMKSVTAEIIKKVERIVVMTETSKNLLIDNYGDIASKIKVIPHGIHPRAFTDGKNSKALLGLEGKKILSTFGLLGAGKGIEFAIDALPEIVKEFPEVRYLIIGATHPVVVKNEGEVYREMLIKRAEDLGVRDNVIFYNNYFKTDELLNFLEATDIYLSLSQNPDQAVSGTLSYALGSGRPVISTSFAQAREIITNDVGSLVGFGESVGLKTEIISMFKDSVRLDNMRKTAYFRTRGMIWPNVTLMYMNEFISISPELGQKENNLPPLNLKHIKKLTDEFGMLQFANLDQPDPKWGYTLDDNARALVVASWCNDSLASIYLDFLSKVSSPDGKFENYVGSDHTENNFRNSTENLEDSNARAMWGLAECAFGGLSDEIRNKALSLFIDHYKKNINTEVSSPRAAAFLIKAFSLAFKNKKGDDFRENIVIYSDFLLKRHNDSSSEGWQWFEESLTYSNAILPEALLIASQITGNQEYFKIGKLTLDFLIQQSFEGGVCVPIGQAGWFKKGEKKHLYDQQPEEVSALVLALRTMVDICEPGEDKEFYKKKMKKAFSWFLGNNIKKQIVYSFETGGCYDGIGEKEINLNQGAESTLSYTLARLAIE